MCPAEGVSGFPLPGALIMVEHHHRANPSVFWIPAEDERIMAHQVCGCGRAILRVTPPPPVVYRVVLFHLQVTGETGGEGQILPCEQVLELPAETGGPNALRGLWFLILFSLLCAIQQNCVSKEPELKFKIN